MLSHLSLFRTAQFALDAVSNSFAPPSTSPSKTVRFNGLICIILGIICIGSFGGLILWTNAPATFLLAPSMLAYTLFTVGGYRLIRGREPAPAHSAEVSISRILLGCLSVFFCFALFFGMLAVAAYLLDWK